MAHESLFLFLDGGKKQFLNPQTAAQRKNPHCGGHSDILYNIVQGQSTDLKLLKKSILFVQVWWEMPESLRGDSEEKLGTGFTLHSQAKGQLYDADPKVKQLI